MRTRYLQVPYKQEGDAPPNAALLPEQESKHLPALLQTEIEEGKAPK